LGIHLPQPTTGAWESVLGTLSGVRREHKFGSFLVARTEHFWWNDDAQQEARKVGLFLLPLI